MLTGDRKAEKKPKGEIAKPAKTASRKEGSVNEESRKEESRKEESRKEESRKEESRKEDSPEPEPSVPSPPDSPSEEPEPAKSAEEDADSSDLDQDVFGARFKRRRSQSSLGLNLTSKKARQLSQQIEPDLLRAMPESLPESLCYYFACEFLCKPQSSSKPRLPQPQDGPDILYAGARGRADSLG